MACDMKRKHLLYKSKVEYMNGDGVYTMNHVLGCSHGCTYCYAYRMAKRFGQVKDYKDWCSPQIVENTLELLEDELSRKRKEPIKRVFMSFMTDPFQMNVTDLSVAAIKLINGHGIPVTTLSKGKIPHGLLWLHPENEFGTTAAMLCRANFEKWEPFVYTINERLRRLRFLSTCGEKTWLSIEPFGLVHPSNDEPHACLERILSCFCFVNRIVFGKANYIPQAYKDPAWYRECVEIVQEFCDERGIECIIKKGTIDG